MKPLRVYLCGGDRSGWAIDEDRRLTAQALEGLVELVPTPGEAQVIHSCWWLPLMELPAAQVVGKPIVCHMAGEPARCFSEVDFAPAMRRVTHWIAQSRQAETQFREAGVACTLVPYAIDVDAFARTPSPSLPPTPPGLHVVRVLRQIPRGAFVIANFHRDAAGAGLNEGRPIPKRVKGPDIFVEILAEARRRGVPAFALLAGPRRHWTRQALAQRGVPFAFAGEPIEGDDYPANILSRSDIASLYARANLVISCGRSEGGPRSVLEAAAAGLPQIATSTGIAPDILSPSCVFDDAVKGVELVVAEVRDGLASRQTARHCETILADHTPDANRGRLRELYETLARELQRGAPPRADAFHEIAVRATEANRSLLRAASGALGAPPRISLWNKFTPPPWGGGNQFMIALKAEAERQGYEVGINGEGIEEGRVYDAHVLNSVQFDLVRFEKFVRPGSSRVVHRIDGPIGLLRGNAEGMEQDRVCFELNARHATATVIQSWHTWKALAELGFSPVNPVLIHNACDPAIFHEAAEPAKLEGPLKVIASCWSPSPGKGAAVYEWMAWNLPEDEFELTYVGNCPIKLPRWKVVAPLPSEELADLLRTQDVFITASRNDPCSNALIEAIACGLPALYLKSGGHPELTRFGGLGFSLPQEIPGLLRRVREHHAIYRALRWPASMEDVASRYLRLALGPHPQPSPKPISQPSSKPAPQPLSAAIP